MCAGRSLREDKSCAGGFTVVMLAMAVLVAIVYESLLFGTFTTATMSEFPIGTYD